MLKISLFTVKIVSQMQHILHFQFYINREKVHFLEIFILNSNLGLANPFFNTVQLFSSRCISNRPIFDTNIIKNPRSRLFVKIKTFWVFFTEKIKVDFKHSYNNLLRIYFDPKYMYIQSEFNQNMVCSLDTRAEYFRNM